MTDNTPQALSGEFVLFQAADGTTRVECRFESDTLWLTQAAMADLYQIGPQTMRRLSLINTICKSYLQVGVEWPRSGVSVLQRNINIQNWKCPEHSFSKQIAREFNA